MNTNHLLLLVAVLLTVSSPSAVDATYIEDISRRAIEDVVEQNYQTAFSRIDSLEQAIGGFEPWSLRAMVYHAQIIDYESFDLAAKFYSACEMVESKSNRELALRPTAANFALGTINGFRANILMREGKWLRSVKYALAMKSNLEEVIARDPEYVDALVGIGSYEYWSARSLNFLPFSGDNRGKGIERIETALNKSKVNKAGAATALIWIYIDQGEGAKALKLSEQWLAKFPTSRSFLWAAGEAALAAHDYPAVLQYYRKILTSVLADPAQRNNYNAFGCYHRLAEISLKTGDRDAARTYIRDAFTLQLSEATRTRKQKDWDDLKRWQQELSE